MPVFLFCGRPPRLKTLSGKGINSCSVIIFKMWDPGDLAENVISHGSMPYLIDVSSQMAVYSSSICYVVF